jgi:hypothetical protein
MRSNHAHQSGIFPDVDSAMQHYLSQIASSAPLATRTIKQLVRNLQSSDPPLIKTDQHHGADEGPLRTAQKRYVRSMFREMINSPEAAYGMMCFLTKQQPKWEEVEVVKAKL